MENRQIVWFIKGESCGERRRERLLKQPDDGADLNDELDDDCSSAKQHDRGRGAQGRNMHTGIFEYKGI